jgi:hypothetical protein
MLTIWRIPVTEGPMEQQPRIKNSVLDKLTVQDFQEIANVTGRIFEIGVHRTDGCLSIDVCLNLVFLLQDLKGKHSWLNARSAKELFEGVSTFFLRARRILCTTLFVY